jgi:hypothetical protein
MRMVGGQLLHVCAPERFASGQIDVHVPPVLTCNPAPVKAKTGIDMIDPPSYTSAWPWVAAKIEHGRRGCGLPRARCFRPADTRSTSG